MGHYWEAVMDRGPFKSEYNGKHDLDGGQQCDICHTWHRYAHILSHQDWDTFTIVGGKCSAMLSDVDPKWAEKKLANAIIKAERERLERVIKEEREKQEAREIAASMIRGFSSRVEVPQRIEQYQTAHTPPRKLATSTVRDCGIIREITKALDDWRSDWQKGWIPTRANPNHFKKEVACKYFQCNCVLFLNNGRYKFVLHMPKSSEIFSDRGYATAADAAAAAYNNMRSHIMSLALAGDSYFVLNRERTRSGYEPDTLSRQSRR
jgi:hypothetical protein